MNFTLTKMNFFRVIDIWIRIFEDEIRSNEHRFRFHEGLKRCTRLAQRVELKSKWHQIHMVCCTYTSQVPPAELVK